jgi:hypothetical protein
MSVRDSTCTIKGQNNAFSPRLDLPPELLRRKELVEAEPEVNSWACLILLVVCVALVGVTAEFVRLPLPRPRFMCRRAIYTFHRSSLKA